jgi:hypothetical protein
MSDIEKPLREGFSLGVATNPYISMKGKYFYAIPKVRAL